MATPCGFNLDCTALRHKSRQEYCDLDAVVDSGVELYSTLAHAQGLGERKGAQTTKTPTQRTGFFLDEIEAVIELAVQERKPTGRHIGTEEIIP